MADAEEIAYRATYCNMAIMLWERRTSDTRAGRMTNVPNKPKTTTSTFRIPTELKAAAQERAEAEGKTLTDVVVEALAKYAKGGKL